MSRKVKKKFGQILHNRDISWVRDVCSGSKATRHLIRSEKKHSQTKKERNKQKRQCALSHPYRRSAVFDEEPNASQPTATIFSTSHSVRLLALPNIHEWAQRSLFASEE
jgi:hypothetical protein